MNTSLHTVTYYDKDLDTDIYCEAEVSGLFGHPEITAIRSVIPGSTCFLAAADADEIARIENDIARRAKLRA